MNILFTKTLCIFSYILLSNRWKISFFIKYTKIYFIYNSLNIYLSLWIHIKKKNFFSFYNTKILPYFLFFFLFFKRFYYLYRDHVFFLLTFQRGDFLLKWHSQVSILSAYFTSLFSAAYYYYTMRIIFWMNFERLYSHITNYNYNDHVIFFTSNYNLVKNSFFLYIDSAKIFYKNCETKYILNEYNFKVKESFDIIYRLKKIKHFFLANVSGILIFLQITILFFFFLKTPKVFFFKILFKNFYFISLVYFIFLTFSFLHFTNFFSRNNSFLSRFWRRSIIIFWLLELLTFGIFLYLTLISPELNKLFFVKKPHVYLYNKYSYYNQFYLMFLLVIVNLCLCVNLKNKTFFSLNFYKLLTLCVVLFMFHFFFYEFMKFFFTLSYHKKKKFEYFNRSSFSKKIFKHSIDEGLIKNAVKLSFKSEALYKNILWNNNFFKKRKVIKNFKYQTRKHFMFLISILKFWHVFFVFFVLLISLKSFYLETYSNTTDLLSANILNINFLLMFNLLSYFILIKQSFYRYTLLRYNIFYYVTWNNWSVFWNEFRLLFTIFCWIT